MPDFKKQISSYLSNLKLPPSREAEIVEELSQHLNDKYEELLAGGVSSQQAMNMIKEDLSGGKLTSGLQAILGPAGQPVVPGAEDSGGFLSGIWKDIQFGARLLRTNLSFTFVAVLSLALGIGANTAIFQLLDAVRLRTLPVQNPQELAQIRIKPTDYGRTGGFTGRNPDLTTAIWESIQAQQQSFSNIGAWMMQSANLNQGGEARDARMMYVSGSFFDTLGVHAVRGRLIGPSDDQKGSCAMGAVISDSFWHSEFGGAATALGSKITLEGHPFEVMGITNSTFFGPEVGRTFDVAVPICSEPVVSVEEARVNNPQAWWLAVIGRLKPGETVTSASAQLASISPGIFQATLPAKYDAQDRKNYASFIMQAFPAGNGVSSLRKNYETPLYLLLAISGFVLVIACMNLANLMVARASARQKEMAVRLALGASRGRLIRQLLAESLLLALIGAACGFALSQILSRILVSFLSTQQSTLFLDLHPDWKLLAFTSGLAIFTSLLFGLVPAIQAARTAPAEAMKSGGRGNTSGAGRFNVRKLLVVTQVALSLVLLVGALLFVRTFQNLMSLDAGIRQENLLSVDVDYTALKILEENRVAFRQEMLTRIQAIPGILAAADAYIVPLSGNGWNESIDIPASNLTRQFANFNAVSPGYFKTVGMTVLAGRDFDTHDAKSSPLVAVVTETYTRKYLKGANPVGTSFELVMQGGKPNVTYQVVGIVRDAKYGDLREDSKPLVFLAEAQDEHPYQGIEVLIRSDQGFPEVATAVKQTVAQINPAVVLKFKPFRAMVREGLLRERLMATLSGFFGLLAAILAMTGLYGVISYMVIRRRNEIGIRIALGAERRNILSMILREAGTLLGAGIAIGILLALLGGGAARALLFGMKPTDPITLIFAAAGLAVVAAAASFIPARRGATIDPMQALREE